MLKRLAVVVAAGLALQACGQSSAPSVSSLAGGGAAIKVLSNRPDLISGGDALVEVVLPVSTDARAVKMDVDGRDVTGMFALRGNGRYMGLVTGLPERTSVLTARLPNSQALSVSITNHPSGGPVFSGPQLQPWICRAGALDAQCNRPPVYAYYYYPDGGSAFAPFDPANPPTDVGQTKTSQGNTVPFIVRVETGNLDRDQYRIAVLYDPSKPWTPWEPQPGWDHKLFFLHGASCGVDHREGDAPDVLSKGKLGAGIAVVSTALDNSGHNCNVVVQAESLMMAKERVVETLGEIRYSMGDGTSGGALAQYWMANAYPGIYDGISVSQSFPDAWTTFQEIEDCALLLDYWGDPTRWAPGVAWDEAQEAGAAGHESTSVCRAWVQVSRFNQLFNPRPDPGAAAGQVVGAQNCGLTASEAYDPQLNPGGPRCTLHDIAVSAFGRRPQDGFANRPYDNVGIQYGLNALRAGTITPAQFLDLNSKIGSHDIDYNAQADRVAADLPALEAVYRGGFINDATHLAPVAVIDLRGADAVEIHHLYRSWATRARMDRAYGNHDNQIIWFGANPQSGDDDFSQDTTLLNRWLAAVEADTSVLTRAQKVARNKPTGVRDRCTNGMGTDLPECVIPPDGSPRMGAGESIRDDIVKCTLKPIDRAEDYGPQAFTEAEWTQLESIFPDGVCAWDRPGIGQQPTQPWMDYSAGPGGQPLPAMATPEGWAGSVFRAR